MRLTAALFASALLAGCVNSPERLPELDRRFYYNLEDPDDQKEFLKLRDEDRQGYLERKGLWEKWIALPRKERETAGDGKIELGFHEFAVLMAWGPPADTQVSDPEARVHTFIRCSSGPKAGRYVRNNLDCNGTSSEIRVSIARGIVNEIKYPN